MTTSAVLLTICPAIFALIFIFIVILQKRRKHDLDTRLKEAGAIKRFFRGPFGLPLILIIIGLLLALIRGHF